MKTAQPEHFKKRKAVSYMASIQNVGMKMDYLEDTVYYNDISQNCKSLQHYLMLTWNSINTLNLPACNHFQKMPK